MSFFRKITTAETESIIVAAIARTRADLKSEVGCKAVRAILTTYAQNAAENLKKSIKYLNL